MAEAKFVPSLFAKGKIHFTEAKRHFSGGSFL
jgi:hypothetical protein